MYNALGKTKAAFEWAKGWEELNEYLKLNAVTTEDGDAAFVVEQSDLVVDEPFIDGTAPRRFSFQLHLVLQWSDGYDDVNEDAIAKMSSWLDWVNAQFDLDNLPDFGESAIITGIESDQNVPTINIVNPEEGRAEYVFFGRIDYIE